MTFLPFPQLKLVLVSIWWGHYPQMFPLEPPLAAAAAADDDDVLRSV